MLGPNEITPALYSIRPFENVSGANALSGSLKKRNSAPKNRVWKREVVYGEDSRPQPFDSDQFIFELKFDGFLALLRTLELARKKTFQDEMKIENVEQGVKYLDRPPSPLCSGAFLLMDVTF